jgi:EpsI family protein
MSSVPGRLGGSAPHFLALLAMAAAAALTAAITPAEPDHAARAFDLDALVPTAFGEWRAVPSPLAQIDLTPRRDDARRTTDRPYDQVVMRTYRRADGATVMLALAHGSRQRQEVKIHRPELCYAAQGFAVSRREVADLELGDGARVPVTRLFARAPARAEPVTYWIRIGDRIAANAWQTRLAILRDGLGGRVPDGMLVRVSTAAPAGQIDARGAYRVQAEFLRELVASLGSARGLLLGARPAS